MRAGRAILVAALVFLAPKLALAQDTPRIVAVNYPLAFMAERLVGSAAEVVFPVPKEVDPSFWRPTIADISMIQSADLILLNGAGFATWVDRVSLPRAKMVNTSAALEDQFIVTKSITHSHGDGGEHSHEGLASYTWLDPLLAVAQAEAVASAILRRDLAPAAEVEAALDALRTEFGALDAANTALLSSAQDIAIIATHPRYQYLAKRYGLLVTSLEWEAGAMPSEAEQAELAAITSDTGARILLWEAAPPEPAIDVAAALGLKSVIFSPLAHQDGDQGFLSAFEGAVQAIADAVNEIGGG
ncbi:MAG: metal ABC transporter substrate-binding protein [Pseudomonadota bacterium]